MNNMTLIQEENKMLNYMTYLVIYLSCIWLFANLHDYSVKKGNTKTSRSTKIMFSCLWPLVTILIILLTIKNIFKPKPRN